MQKSRFLHPGNPAEVEWTLRRVIASIRDDLSRGIVPHADGAPEVDGLSRLIESVETLAAELNGLAPANTDRALPGDSEHSAGQTGDNGWECATRIFIHRVQAGIDDAYLQASAAADSFRAAKRHRAAGQIDATVTDMARGATWLAYAINTFYLAPRRRGARVTLSRSPAAKVKPEARKLWQDWQAGRTRYKSGAAFARHVVDAFPDIESTKTVERWATQWRKEAKATK